MPQSLTISAFVFGAVLVLISLAVGKFKLFGAEVEGTVGRAGRVIAFLLGILLLSIGLLSNNRPDNQEASNTDRRTVKREPETTQNLRDYMVGTWEFRVAAPSTKIVSTFDITFSRNGDYSGTRSVNKIFQTAFSGTWVVQPNSSDRFTLTLSAAGEDSKAVALRVIDDNSVEDLDIGSRWLREGR